MYTVSPLILHFIVGVNKVLIIILVILALELLIRLCKVNVLAARAAADDVGRLDFLHVVFVGLFGCFQ